MNPWIDILEIMIWRLIWFQLPSQQAPLANVPVYARLERERYEIQIAKCGEDDGDAD